MTHDAGLTEPIAIIGLWCRVPGAESPEEFWANLTSGTVSIADISRDELLAAGVDPQLMDDPSYVPRRGILQNATSFDASRFNISPAEAELTDPQHRQFLECAYLALGDAGLAEDSRRDVGVFATQSRNGYRESCDVTQGAIRRFSADIVNGMAHVATTVAYRLGTEGPAVTIQSACSSSLVAVHMACQALRMGDCGVAVAGGASIGWPQHQGYLYVPGGIMSTDGRCTPFDAKATGTVRGEGVGVVVLQLLRAAERAGRSIRAVIAGSAVNNDGSARMGFATPSAAGQVRVIRRALAVAGISPGRISMIETHGTGTIVGDAIELSALHEVLRSDRHGGRSIWLGATKANIGHLDAAAGVVGLIKTVLCLTHRVLPPVPGFSAFHPECEPYSADFRAPTSLVPLSSDDPLVAGVSSFGLGGTNAHVIMREYVATPTSDEEAKVGGAFVFPLVGESSGDLTAWFDSIRSHATSHGVRPSDAAHVLALRADRPGIRGTVLVTVEAESVAWGGVKTSGTPKGKGESERFAFLFGAYRASKERFRELYDQCELFRRHFDPMAAKVFQETGVDPCGVANGDMGADGLEVPLSRLCIDVAMARLLTSLGLKIEALVAKEVGEIAAACVAGALAPEEAGELVGLLFGSRAGQRELKAWVDELAARPHVRWFARGRWVSTFDPAMMLKWRDLEEAGPDGTAAASEELHGVPLIHVGILADEGLLGASSRPDPGYIRLLRLLEDAWLCGGDVDWRLLCDTSTVRDVSLPASPLRRVNFQPRRNTDTTASAAQWPTNVREPMTQATIDSHPVLEGLVRGSFEAVLQVTDVSRHDNFFDLGGCSLTALDVLDRIAAATGLKVGLREFLHEPTVQALADQLARARLGTSSSEQPQGPSPARRIPQGSVDAPANASPSSSQRPPPNFSVFFFAGEAPQDPSEDIYYLVKEVAKVADAEGFEAVWVPERHFHKFGGLFPSPAVLGAALAAITDRVSIRAGSVVLPLHNPVEVAEQWSVVDNLSNGRVGISLAPGFHPTDFSLCPEKYADRRNIFWDGVTKLRALWAGNPFAGKDGLSRDVQLVPLPRPQQKQLPLWITASESEQTFREAGVRGANLLTALLALDVSTLEKRIKVYREALKESGTSTGGRVTAMLHAYVDPDPAKVEAIGVHFLKKYLETHLDFASARAEYGKVAALSDSDREALVNHAAQRYLNDGSMVGTPAHCATLARKLISIGVDEIACLVDFGVPCQEAIASLKQIALLRAEIRLAR